MYAFPTALHGQNDPEGTKDHRHATDPSLFVIVLTFWLNSEGAKQCIHSAYKVSAIWWDKWTMHCGLCGTAITSPLSPSVFYIHYVLLFPMKLVAYSSAVWQIRCAVKWSMTESSGRLDPLQSYPAITIPSFLWGNTQGRERKLDQIFYWRKELDWQGKEMKQSFFPFFPPHFCQSIALKAFCLGIECSF